jgi:hypothetical protein
LACNPYALLFSLLLLLLLLLQAVPGGESQQGPGAAGHTHSLPAGEQRDYCYICVI